MPILRVMCAGGALVGISKPNFAIDQGASACRFRNPAHGRSQVLHDAPLRIGFNALGYGVKI
jgi:hypothetical protein